jgi:hypothetical protein
MPKEMRSPTKTQTQTQTLRGHPPKSPPTTTTTTKKSKRWQAAPGNGNDEMTAGDASIIKMPPPTSLDQEMAMTPTELERDAALNELPNKQQTIHNRRRKSLR